jgi:hypothetical protein
MPATLQRKLRRTGPEVRRAAIGHALAHVRRRYYAGGRNQSVVAALPPAGCHRIGLDDLSAVIRRRIEVGGGPHGVSGHIHVDVDPGADHLEAIAKAWQLPFPDGWTIETVSIHSLEHVPGFRDVVDLAGKIGDRHAITWADIVPSYSLVVRAVP